MHKLKLTKMGNSNGVIIPKNYLKAMGVDLNTKFEIMTDGVSLLLKPVKTNKGEKND